MESEKRVSEGKQRDVREQGWDRKCSALDEREAENKGRGAVRRLVY